MNILVSIFDGHVHSFLLDILGYRVAVFEPCRFCQAVFQSNCIHWQIVQEFYFPLLNMSLPASISVFHLSHLVECVESHYCVIRFFLMTVRLYNYFSSWRFGCFYFFRKMIKKDSLSLFRSFLLQLKCLLQSLPTFIGFKTFFFF